MDTFLGILAFIAIMFGIAFFKIILIYSLRTVEAFFSALKRTLLGSGSSTFLENFKIAMFGMKNLEIRMVDERLNNKPDGALFKSIEVKGLLPNQYRMKLAFVVSIIDVTDEKNTQPVISILEDFQEKNTYSYQHFNSIGELNGNQGYVNWVRAGIIIPDILQTAYSGNRNLKVVLRLVDLDNLPRINDGFHTIGDEAGMIWIQTIPYSFYMNDVGFIENIDKKEELEIITVNIGIAVAMADNDFVDEEGLVIKGWIEKTINNAPSAERERLKTKYNENFKETYLKSQKGELDLSQLLNRMNKIGDKKSKYAVVDLCYDIVASDGKMEAIELQKINNITNTLNLNHEEIQRIKDQKIVKLNINNAGGASTYDILGINSAWSEEEISKHLRIEFQKWNSRLNSLPEGQERENAQRMLNLISEEKTKLDSRANKSA